VHARSIDEIGTFFLHLRRSHAETDLFQNSACPPHVATLRTVIRSSVLHPHDAMTHKNLGKLQ
jgi:hypothetical protein